MTVEAMELPFLVNIGLLLTRRCTAACPHCIVEAGPDRTDEMTTDDALSWTRQAREYREGHIRGIGLTGGEPFLNMDLLTRVSTYARSLGFVVSAVTNAFWASTEEAAIEVLSRLPAVGILSMSTDAYHQEFIPFEHVKNAVRAARKLGRLYSVAVCTRDEGEPGYRKTVEELEAIGEGGRIMRTMTFPVGRAGRHAGSGIYRTEREPTPAACMTAGSPIILPNGDVVACIGPVLTLPPGHPLFLGRLREEPLSAILDRAEVNEVLHAIRVWGPHRLVALLKEAGYGGLLPQEYIRDCTCDACYRVMSDERLANATRVAVREAGLTETIAYARIYYLNESAMADMLRLDGGDWERPRRRRRRSRDGR